MAAQTKALNWLKPTTCSWQITSCICGASSILDKIQLHKRCVRDLVLFSSTQTTTCTLLKWEMEMEKEKTKKQVPVGSWPGSFPVVQLIIPNMCCIMHKTICSLFLMSMNIKTACCSLVHVVYSCSCVCRVMRLTSESPLKSSQIIN